MSDKSYKKEAEAIEKNRPKFKGPKNRQQARKMERKGKINANKMNAGGFYEGMPGVTLDENSNWRMINVFVQEDGTVNAQIWAHNRIIKRSMESLIQYNPMIRGVFYGVVLDNIFKNPTPWNWALRMRIKLWRHFKDRRHRRNNPDMVPPKP